MTTIKRYSSAKPASYAASAQSNSNSPKGSINSPYTLNEFYDYENGTWPGGYVEGLGYVPPDVVIWGSQSSSSNPDSWGSDISDPWGSDTSDLWGSDGSSSNPGNTGGGGGGGTTGGGRPGGTTTGGTTSGNTNENESQESEESRLKSYFTKAEAEEQFRIGRWHGGYITGLGYVLPNATSLPTTKIFPKNGVEALANAKLFDGTPYIFSSEVINRNGIDCSGLVSAAYNIDPRWSTSAVLSGFTRISVNQTSYEAFVNSLQIGDVLVWDGHAALHEGGGKLFHAHGKAVSSTSDLKSYWIKAKGYPAVYRK
ncbi:MAG: C40 family peptidase [Bacteroides sp.]|nr:C40 family peptidase [Roseburia sp.]MCM1347460.1 C40 family peptidase [Bacteroides sp.]MCM1421935.1 C40 family peptidase [Bacteroides sp.]